MTYMIERGVLHDGGVPVRQMPSPNHSGAFRQAPAILVMHYTAGGSAEGSASWLANPQANASAHIVIGRDGRVIQCVSLDNRAWHAGRSSWQGLSGLNSYAIGIELANWGPITASGSAPYIEAAHKNGGPVRRWEAYPEAQIVAAEAVARAIAAYHPIAEIVGHDDIAPGRKLDPGPAFEMAAFRTAVLGTGKRRHVTASRLNVRAGPGGSFPVLTSLTRGTPVSIREARGAWLRIGEDRWVSGAYVA